MFSDGVELIGDAAPVGSQPLSPPVSPSAVPEPAAMTMFLAGLVGVGVMRRRVARATLGSPT